MAERRGWRAAVRRWGVAAGAVLCAPVGLTACDPCAGVVACRQAPRLGVGGQIVDRGEASGVPSPSSTAVSLAVPSPGVRVQVVPTGGVALDEAPAAVTTDGTGWWQVSVAARDTGTAVVDVLVTPPGGVAYSVRGVQLQVSRGRGRGNVLGRWTREPYISAVGEVFERETGAPVAGARVVAVRRGGVAIAPTVNTRSPMVTVDGGRFHFDVRPLGDGPLVADFVIERDGFPSATVRNVTVAAQYEWLPPNVNGDLIFRIDAAGNAR